MTRRLDLLQSSRRIDLLLTGPGHSGAALRFTSQPSNQTVSSGDTATFSVTVTGGTPPYSYQWQLDSGSGFANIMDATSASYETPALTTGDTGNEYRCVVTDDASAEITSNAAVVTVVTGFLLMETGDALLLETGDKILLETG